MTLTTIPRDTYTYIHTYYYWIPACNNTIDIDVIDHDATHVSNGCMDGIGCCSRVLLAMLGGGLQLRI